MTELILPIIDEVNRPFWEACRQERLVLQRCGECRRLRYPIATICPHCLSPDCTWEQMSGRGRIYSFTVFRHAYNQAWRDRVPYAVALIALEEGPFMLADVVGTSPEQVHVDLLVTVVFDPVTDEVTVPRFTPAS